MWLWYSFTVLNLVVWLEINFSTSTYRKIEMILNWLWVFLTNMFFLNKCLHLKLFTSSLFICFFLCSLLFRKSECNSYTLFWASELYDKMYIWKCMLYMTMASYCYYCEVSKLDVTMLINLIIFFHCYFFRLQVQQHQTPNYIFMWKDVLKMKRNLGCRISVLVDSSSLPCKASCDWAWFVMFFFLC